MGCEVCEGVIWGGRWCEAVIWCEVTPHGGSGYVVVIHCRTWRCKVM